MARSWLCSARLLSWTWPSRKVPRWRLFSGGHSPPSDVSLYFSLSSLNPSTSYLPGMVPHVLIHFHPFPWDKFSNFLFCNWWEENFLLLLKLNVLLFLHLVQQSYFWEFFLFLATSGWKILHKAQKVYWPYLLSLAQSPLVFGWVIGVGGVRRGVTLDPLRLFRSHGGWHGPHFCLCYALDRRAHHCYKQVRKCGWNIRIWTV